MEYTIYTESLVYYVIRKDGLYLNRKLEFTASLMDAYIYDSLSEVKSLVKCQRYQGCEVRKVKMIDIGEA